MALRLDSKSLRTFIATSRGKSYTVAASTILLILLLVVVGIFPAVNSVLFQYQENDRKTAVLGSMTTKIATIRALTQEEELNPVVSAALEKDLPNSINQEDLYELISDGAVKNNVTVGGISFSEPDASRKLPLIFNGVSQLVDSKLVTITLTGQKADLENFLKYLENSRRIFNVLSVSLFKLEDDSGIVTDTTPSGMNILSEIYFWNTTKQIN